MAAGVLLLALEVFVFPGMTVGWHCRLSGRHRESCVETMSYEGMSLVGRTSACGIFLHQVRATGGRVLR